MGQNYEHISLEERCHLSHLRQQGCSIRKIAATLDRSPSTIAREIKRNAAAAYQPSYAHQIAHSRRWRGSKLLRNQALQHHVLHLLSRGWSPEQVTGRLTLDHGHTIISYESIYRFIYAQIARTKDYRWRHYLPRSKSKRGFRGSKGGSSVHTIPHRVSIHQRPSDVLTRKQPGHWEADLMSFSKYGHFLLALQDRFSRLLVLTHQPDKSARGVADQLRHALQALPRVLRQTITFDNGTEFAHHQRLHALNLKTYFCDPRAPWQKGGIENAIGRMRKGLPRKTNLAALSSADLAIQVAAYNHTPRKCLDYRTPAEVFSQHLLHFKCESTSRLSSG